MSDFEISERKLRASPEFFIFFYNSFFAVASIIKGIKKSSCEHELKKSSVQPTSTNRSCNNDSTSGGKDISFFMYFGLRFDATRESDDAKNHCIRSLFTLVLDILHV